MKKIDYQTDGSIPVKSPFSGDDWATAFSRPMVGGGCMQAGDILMIGYCDSPPVLLSLTKYDIEDKRMTFDPDQVIAVYRGCNRIS